LIREKSKVPIMHPQNVGPVDMVQCLIDEDLRDRRRSDVCHEKLSFLPSCRRPSLDMPTLEGNGMLDPKYGPQISVQQVNMMAVRGDSSGLWGFQGMASHAGAGRFRKQDTSRQQAWINGVI
jgi:hypothetical protein